MLCSKETLKIEHLYKNCKKNCKIAVDKPLTVFKEDQKTSRSKDLSVGVYSLASV